MEAGLTDRARLEQGLESLPGIGARRAERIGGAWNVHSVEALLRVLPMRYEDVPPLVGADGLVDGARVRVRARVLGVSLWRRGRRSRLSVRLDVDGTPAAALYFNQPYLKEVFPDGRELMLEGVVQADPGVRLLAPRVVAESEADDEPRPRPVYPEAEGVPARTLQRALASALPLVGCIADPLPEAVRAVAGVDALGQALAVLHDPPGRAEIESARRRLAWGEALRLEHRRLRGLRGAGRGTVVPESAWTRILARIPFPLGEEQEAAVAALRVDLASSVPMRRLLHGEVGSGKTAVAFAAMLAVAASGGQAALLAPTEILARQHLDTFRGWLRGARLQVVGLLGDDSTAARRDALQELASGRAGIAIGTHALFGDAVRFADLALVVYDEQHRFGVRQKAALAAKGRDPHVLTMTATPIPRTLAWARYGALEPLVLRARAGAQADLRTSVHPTEDWLALAEALRPALEAGERAFVVAPRIDGEQGLLAWRERLFGGPWRGLSGRLVHGRMPGAEVAAAVAAFRAGRSAVLLGTTVVEVGLDIPDVSHMLVLEAERLGLASLHQLRGRLARGVGARPGHCRLLAAVAAQERLSMLEDCTDGFQVAAADLRERGPGALVGTRQHGRSDFQVFDPVLDADLIDLLAHEEVRNWLLELD